MPKISVIIPVYNAQKYLRRCLDSVCNQTINDIEIICVDDCSTDKSLEILKEYSKKYSQMRIIHHEVNGGESKTRNTGMDNAIGEYLAFIDNDDEIDLDFYEKLYNKALEENADISKGEVHVFNYDSEELYGNLNEKIRENKSKLYFTYYWWTAIYKRTIIKDNCIRFLEGYPLGGDVLFLNEVILKSNKISLVDDTYYHYYRREDSGDSKVLSFEKVKSVLDIHERIVDNILKSEIDDIGVKYVNSWCLNSALRYAFRYKTINTLKYAVNKALSIYAKTYNNLEDNNDILPVIHHYLKAGDKEDLFKFYLKNDTNQKMFIANLRYLHSQNLKEVKSV